MPSTGPHPRTESAVCMEIRLNLNLPAYKPMDFERFDASAMTCTAVRKLEDLILVNSSRDDIAAPNFHLLLLLEQLGSRADRWLQVFNGVNCVLRAHYEALHIGDRAFTIAERELSIIFPANATTTLQLELEVT